METKWACGLLRFVRICLIFLSLAPNWFLQSYILLRWVASWSSIAWFARSSLEYVGTQNQGAHGIIVLGWSNGLITKWPMVFQAGLARRFTFITFYFSRPTKVTCLCLNINRSLPIFIHKHTCCALFFFFGLCIFWLFWWLVKVELPYECKIALIRDLLTSSRG